MLHEPFNFDPHWWEKIDRMRTCAVHGPDVPHRPDGTCRECVPEREWLAAQETNDE